MTTNPYTGLPDDLHDKFVDIKIFEHPETLSDYRGSNCVIPITVWDDGWELICITHVRRVAQSAERHMPPQEAQVPVYIVGRRRDQYIEDLRQQQKEMQKSHHEHIGRMQQENQRLRDRLYEGEQLMRRLLNDLNTVSDSESTVQVTKEAIEWMAKK